MNKILNANGCLDTGVAIKPEPDNVLQPPPRSPTGSLKRQRSEEPDDVGEKRQRVESTSGIDVDDDMGALFAQAAAAAARHIEESSSDTIHDDAGADRAMDSDLPPQASDSTSDSRALAQALSLPMLESLVSFYPSILWT